MNFVIPMAGEGRRFTEAGYDIPKLLLKAHGRTLLEWSVESLPLELCSRLVFVGLREHNETHHLEEELAGLYPEQSIGFVWIDRTTRGQAETVMLAEPYLLPDRDLVIFNIDTAFHSPGLAEKLAASENDGVLGAFHSDEPRFSYAEVDGGGRVTQVREKVVISPYALTGLYHFKRTTDFLRIARNAIAEGRMEKGEYYVAPLYNDLIREGAKLIVDVCDEHDILGTPAEYEEFLQNRR